MIRASHFPQHFEGHFQKVVTKQQKVKKLSKRQGIVSIFKTEQGTTFVNAVLIVGVFGVSELTVLVHAGFQTLGETTSSTLVAMSLVDGTAASSAARLARVLTTLPYRTL